MIAPEFHHRLARKLCGSFNNIQPIMAHAGRTTDLVLGGGCPRCNRFLQAFRDLLAATEGTPNNALLTAWAKESVDQCDCRSDGDGGFEPCAGCQVFLEVNDAHPKVWLEDNPNA